MKINEKTLGVPAYQSAPAHKKEQEKTLEERSIAPTIVELKGISTRFGRHVVHQSLDLSIRQGEIIGLIGGSGSGKSVLLRTIIGLNQQKAGTVSIMGVIMNTASEEVRAKIRNSWGILFQDGALFSSLTVLENITFPLREFTSIPSLLSEKIGRMKLGMVGLPQSSASKYPSELSGGMRKRAGLARALVLDPQLLLLDEPTAGLDPLGAADFDSLVLTLRASLGLTICMVTHDLDSLHTICDRVAVLSDKKIVALDTVVNLMHNPYPWIQEYFNGPRGRVAFATAEKNQAKTDSAETKTDNADVKANKNEKID